MISYLKEIVIAINALENEEYKTLKGILVMLKDEFQQVLGSEYEEREE